MKIPRNPLDINRNITKIDSNKIFLENISKISLQYIPFTDAIDRQLTTPVMTDHVLVLGSKSIETKEIANQIQSHFSRIGYLSKIITANNFLLLDFSHKRSREILYIIICNKFNYSHNKLNILSSYTSSKIIFKIPGLEWDFKRLSEFKMSMSAKSVLGALQIRGQLDKGLLASLEVREFCVISDHHIRKRKIPYTDISQRLVENPCKMCTSRLFKS